MAAWPAQLPAPALNSFSESLPNNTIRSSVDVGPAKVRRRTTANVRPISFVLKLTSEQWDILEDFFLNDTFSGSDSFDYTHPVSGLGLTARFAEPPSRQDVEGVVWNAAISLEILPS